MAAEAIDDGFSVLILLLVEYPFGLFTLFINHLKIISLNPSFSGISFRTIGKTIAFDKATGSLNPSFSGISFRTKLQF